MNDVELTYVDEVWDSSFDRNVTAEELEEFITDAEEYLDGAKYVESVARSCARGWRKHIDKLQARLSEIQDVATELQPSDDRVTRTDVVSP